MLYFVRVYRGIIITKVFSSESEILMALCPMIILISILGET